jgi:hypothetical protein
MLGDSALNLVTPDCLPLLYLKEIEFSLFTPFMHVSVHVHVTRRPEGQWGIWKEYLTQNNAIGAQN